MAVSKERVATKAPSAEPYDHTHSNAFTNTVGSEHDMSFACDVVDGSASPAVGAESLHYIRHHTRPSSATRGGTSSEPRRVITTASLLAFCFFAVCGGPAGSEELVIGGGPLTGIIAMLVFPIIFYLPLSYMAAELATALPVSGGQAYWVALAFGPSWGFQAGYWCWVSNCIDCSMFAAMTISAIMGPGSTIKTTVWDYLIKALFAIGLALPALWSLRAVANILLLITIFVLISYGFVSLWAGVEANRWEELLEIRRANTTPTADHDFLTTGAIAVDWSSLLNALVWGYSGFTNLSVFAAQVINPERTYRSVLWMSSSIITLTYVIPYATLTAIDKPDWRLWVDGSLSDVTKTFGGDAVGWWIMVVNLLCSSGLYVCALTTSAFLANGMATHSIAPTTLGLSTASGTPHGAIFCSLAVILIVVNLEFFDMLKLTNALGGLEAIFVIVSALRLRFTMKDLRRPIKLCGDAHPVVPMLVLLIPLGLYVFVIIDAFQTFLTAALTAAFLFIGLVYSCQADYTKFRDQRNETFRDRALRRNENSSAI